MREFLLMPLAYASGFSARLPDPHPFNFSQEEEFMLHRDLTKRRQLQPVYRRVCLILLFAVTPLLTVGCYGRFPLTKAVYRFNGDITDNKWIHSIILWIFVILPVYSIAMFGDAIILNLIEFWTGETLEISSYTREDGAEVVLEPSADGNEAVLTITKNGEVLGVQRYVRQADGSIQVLDVEGNLAGAVLPTANGGFDLTDADGNVVNGIPGEAIAALRAS
jgi:hypothetical protein